MGLNEIFHMTDPSNFSGKFFDYLLRKSNYGERLTDLNSFELRIYFIEELQAEVMNGGFAQYFFNSSGNHWEETISACETIGTVNTADLLRKAVQAFECELPKDRKNREDAIENQAKEGYDERLAALDSVFYDYEENVDTLIFEYCQQNKKSSSTDFKTMKEDCREQGMV